MDKRQKDPQRQLQGRLAKERGRRFEERLAVSFDHYYRTKGLAIVEKTPEPMRPTRSLGGGKFVAHYERKAQPDYKGTVLGGRTVLIEAKFTTQDRIEQSRVLPAQADCMTRHAELGAMCYVVVGFGSGDVFRIPWSVWSDMKQRFGRKYALETELAPWRVPLTRNGILLLLD